MIMETDRLFKAAKWRWLKASEIFILLRTSLNNTFKTVDSYTQRPQSGDIFFISKERFKRWKQDGHQYILRRSSSGIREDREKYHDDVDTIQCVYAHGGGQCFNCKTIGIISCGECGYPVTPLTFHRRAYWLLSNPQIILVHYLDDTQKDEITERAFSKYSTESSMMQEHTENVKNLEEVLKHYDLEEVPMVSIIDYTPDWGDVSGGTKILVCIEPAIMVPQPYLLYCMFGSIKVLVESVQLGVLRCFSPSHPAEVVDFYIVYNGKEISESRKTFEFREVNALSANTQTTDWWRQSADILCKDLFATINDIAESPGLVEDFDEGFFLNFLEQNLHMPQSRILNRKGIGIVHYCAVLNLHNCIRLCSNFNLDLNLKTINGLTALELAAYKSNKESIIALLELGADIARCQLDKANALLPFFSGMVSNLSQHAQQFQSQVSFIQKNVRYWLYKKQLEDIRCAAKRLQKAVRGMLARKHFKFQRRAAVMIQKSVRKWLKRMHNTSSLIYA